MGAYIVREINYFSKPTNGIKSSRLLSVPSCVFAKFNSAMIQPCLGCANNANG